MSEAEKYAEYKNKLGLWVQIFVEEHGRAPTDADKEDDAQWMALSAKAQHYRSLMAHGTNGDNPGGGGREPSRAKKY